MIAEDITLEWDEDGLHLSVDGETWRVADPEALYDRCKAAILPWLMERDEALRTMPRAFACNPDESGGFALSDDSGYDRSDPKHPDWHSVHADIWDMREGK